MPACRFRRCARASDRHPHCAAKPAAEFATHKRGAYEGPPTQSHPVACTVPTKPYLTIGRYSLDFLQVSISFSHSSLVKRPVNSFQQQQAALHDLPNHQHHNFPRYTPQKAVIMVRPAPPAACPSICGRRSAPLSIRAFRSSRC